MTVTDIIILFSVVLLLGLIIYFNIIKPKIKHQNGCCKCPYSKQCSKNYSNCSKTKYTGEEHINKK